METDSATHWVTCETPACTSSGAPIRMQYPEDVTAVVCGVCGNQITNITDTAPETPTEVPQWLL